MMVPTWVGNIGIFRFDVGQLTCRGRDFAAAVRRARRAVAEFRIRE